MQQRGYGRTGERLASLGFNTRLPPCRPGVVLPEAFSVMHCPLAGGLTDYARVS